MYQRQTTGFFWLLALIILHVIPASWSQQIPGKDHRAYNSSLYEQQHVFSRLWKVQLHQKAVYLRHIGKGRSQQIYNLGNNFPQREKYDFSRQQHASSYGIFEYSFQDQASFYGKCQRNLQDIIISSAGELNSPRAEPLAQQRQQLILTTDVQTDIA